MDRGRHVHVHYLSMATKRSFPTFVLVVFTCGFYIFLMSGFQRESIPYESVADGLQNEVTVVSAFWDIGKFKKGKTEGLFYSHHDYKAWCSVFKHIQNPFIFYTDSDDFYELMTRVREKLRNKTIIIKMDRKTLWSFQIEDKIRNIFDQEDYPKFEPNTVVPAYSCAQHAKYAVLADAINKRYINTTYMAWTDVGYFRDLKDSVYDFEIVPPQGMQPRTIAMNRIKYMNVTQNISEIFKKNGVWVGGGFLLAEKQLILRFEKLYRKAVMKFISMNLINTDQQVVYALYSKEGRKLLKPDIELQLYIPESAGNIWFYLGFLCRKVLHTPTLEHS